MWSWVDILIGLILSLWLAALSTSHLGWALFGWISWARRMKASGLTDGNPLIRTQREQVAETGVEFTPRIVGNRDGKPDTKDNQMSPGAVIWADVIVWITIGSSCPSLWI